MTGTEDDVRTDVGDEREALHVPRLLRSAVVVLADGRRLPGRVFLPAAAAGHPGAMRVDEWLNEKGDFFPFLRDGEGSPTILNKRQTVAVTVPAATDVDDTLDAAPAPVQRVHVDCGGFPFEGEVVIDMPAQHSRLLDLLNRDRPFLVVRDGERHHLVRRSLITEVRELPGRGGRS